MSGKSGTPPTIYEWGGGRRAFARWLDVFYDLVEGDDLGLDISSAYPKLAARNSSGTLAWTWHARARAPKWPATLPSRSGAGASHRPTSRD